MNTRLRKLGLVLAAFGLVFVAAGGFAFLKAQEGYRSLQAFSAAQNVTLSYNEAGQLVDRGETEGAAGDHVAADQRLGLSRSMQGELNPNDPLVNTASEYMYQMATIAYHTLHGTTTVVLDEDVTADNGTVYAAGSTSSPPKAATGPASTGPTRSRLRPASRSGPARPTR